MTIRVRESTEDDIPAIARIAAAAFHPETDAIAARLFPARLAGEGEAYSWRYAKKTASLSSTDAIIVVAVDDSLNGQVVGFALWDVYMYGQPQPEKAANQPPSAAQQLPPPSFDQEAYAELRAIVSADHQEMFGERGIKDVWRKFPCPALPCPALPWETGNSPCPYPELPKTGTCS
ncbi:hypothetical protein THARTR1_04247 [Trichoderma harzianum]|uniref:N-acetyltransferase domain-containing protein n=1 Tax=Trichoderma harzianum TaxID=5544 RepID=A0A2K0UCC8_TRIHA|nr:hypothetical protein THARTR1_04247 [Trichoderma harzianum]